MVLVRANVLNPIVRVGDQREVADSESVRRLVKRGVLEYVEETGEADMVEPRRDVDTDDVDHGDE